MSDTRPRGRAGIACQQCRKQKIRCNGDEPCERCHRLRFECIFGPTAKSSQIDRPRRSSSTTTTLVTNRYDSPISPTIHHGQTRYSSTSSMRTDPTPKRQTSATNPTPAHVEHVSPPFSTFTYQPAPDPPVQDLLVPLCAQPFPELRDPIDCGIVSLPFAKWLFEL